jgi:CheY-like chemotaxis protein
VTVRAERDNGTRARIHVIDTGPGIPADEVERVFMPFARLSTAHKIEGTGLGLALSRSLAEGMGGSLTVDSSQAGSTFTVDLPLAGEGDTPSSATRAPAEWTPEDDERLCRILYIEDNEDNVAVVDRLCRRRGDLELHSAARGDAGLELARRLYPDAILLDLYLPDTTADKVIAELRADADLRETPVIVVTADVTQDHEQRMRAAGATAYLTKPLDLGRLQQELDRALGG